MKEVKHIKQSDLGRLGYEEKKSGTAAIFAESIKESAGAVNAKPLLERQVIPQSPKWEGSAGQAALYHEIQKAKQALLEKAEDAANPPTQTEIESLVGKQIIDITRRIQDIGDMTDLIATEMTDYDFQERFSLVNLKPYVGAFTDIRLLGDSVPLIEEQTGADETVTMLAKGLGYKTSLKNILFNPLHSMMRVNQAFANAYVDYRNDRLYGEITRKTFANASGVVRSVAADETEGATFDVHMYNTIKNAVKALRNLYNVYTNRKISVPSITCLCNSYDSFEIRRVIYGQLASAGSIGLITSINAQALPIDTIIEFDHGNMDGYAWGKKTLSFPGVPQGVAYLYVPGITMVATKRPMTLSSGPGRILDLSTTEMAAYTCGAVHDREFFGSTSATINSKYGYIVKVVLPTE